MLQSEVAIFLQILSRAVGFSRARIMSKNLLNERVSCLVYLLPHISSILAGTFNYLLWQLVLKHIKPRAMVLTRRRFHRI